MKSVKFGRTGLNVSELCCGTMTFGSSKWKPWALDEAESKPIIKKAVDEGINFFDMADWYSNGESERIVGSVLMDMMPRDRLVLTTKAFYSIDDNPNGFGSSRKHLMSAIDNSLERIGTDYVDIYMVHAHDPNTPYEETMEALHDIVKSGKARYIGASTMYTWQFAQMNAVARENGWTPFVNMQCQYNLLYREEEREMIPYCKDQGIAVTCFSPLARGWLAGANDIRSETDYMQTDNFGDALDREICKKVESIAANHGVSMAEVGMAWVRATGNICSPLVGASEVSHIETSVKGLGLKLTSEEIEALSALYRPRDLINDYVTNPIPRHLGGVKKD